MSNPVSFLDYETEAIGKRPDYPPKPVGAALILPGRRPRYYSWGHPTGNNCTKAEFGKILKDTAKCTSICYHNGKFDMEVSQKHFGLRLPNPDEWHDTMLLAYLHNPREVSNKLKVLADGYLDMPPDEQEELRDWIIENVPAAKKHKTKWAEYIAYAPGRLVGKYAKGDVVRTKGLFNEFYPYVVEQGMLSAYNGEKKLTPIIIDMEQRGIPIDVKRLEQDLPIAKKNQEAAQRRFFKRLGKEINMNSPKQKFEAFEEAGLVDEWNYNTDDKGNPTSPKTGINDLLLVCNDVKLVRELQLYSKLQKLITTYMTPWLESGQNNNGVFYPWFNQTFSDDDKGTKTGRFSSNFQQVPQYVENRVKLPPSIVKQIPYMRNYVVGDTKQHIVLQRDFSQQEIRVLSYYEEGILYDEYLKNPRLDVHALVGKIITDITGLTLHRNVIKTCNFLIVYGGGAPALSEQLGKPIDECREILKVHRKALPGVDSLRKEIDKLVRKGEPIYTAAGREYYAERGYEYRSLNTLIQGGSADHTKYRMIDLYDEFKGTDTRMLIQVHDELIMSAPARGAKRTMKRFREVMEADKLFNPIPMLSDGKVGKSWGEAQKAEI